MKTTFKSILYPYPTSVGLKVETSSRGEEKPKVQMLEREGETNVHATNKAWGPRRRRGKQENPELFFWDRRGTEQLRGGNICSFALK